MMRGILLLAKGPVLEKGEHDGLTLTLFMTGVTATDHAYLAVAADDLA
jgi:hypothetical protein